MFEHVTNNVSRFARYNPTTDLQVVLLVWSSYASVKQKMFERSTKTN